MKRFTLGTCNSKEHIMTENSNEKNLCSVILDVKSEDEISRDDLSELNELFQEEINAAKLVKDKRSQELTKRLLTAEMTAFAIAALTSTLPTKTIFARDLSGKLLGFCVAGLDPDSKDSFGKVKGIHLGVRTKNQGHGIGPKMLKAENKVLRDMGIEFYRINARQETVPLLRRLGTRFTEEPMPTKPSSGAVRLTVFLK